MKLRHIWFVIAAAMIFFIPQPAFTAQVTDVLDAVDDDELPLDFSISIDFTQELEWGRITRERNTADNGSLNQEEFIYKNARNLMNITGRIGMYKDLELHFILPIHIKETYTGEMSDHWKGKYWSGSYGWNSMESDQSFANMPAEELLYGPSLISDRVFGFTSWESTHSGFGDMTIGLSYAPLNEERDETFPTLKFTFDMQIPTGKETDPKMEPSASDLSKGISSELGVGKKLLRIIIEAAISKRMSIADPYFAMNYKGPVSLGGHIEKPRHEGGFLLGTELVAYEEFRPEEKEPWWKVAFDLRMNITMYGKGQDFNEITDPLSWRRDKVNDHPEGTTYWPVDPRTGNDLGYIFPKGRAPEYELPIEDSYTYIKGLVGFYAIIYHYIFIKNEYTFGHRTEHFLSLPDKLDSQDLRPSPDGNGYSKYNAQINEVGMRVKKEKSFVFSYSFSLGASF